MSDTPVFMSYTRQELDAQYDPSSAVSDIADYVRTGLHAILSSESFSWPVETATDWRVRSADWPETRYEAKAEREGRQRYYFRFFRSD